MMRGVHGSTVLYPADGTSTAALVETMAATPGIIYLRTTRGSYPGLYPDGETFPIGGSKVLRSSDHDEVTLVGAGVTLDECLRAADILAAEGISARVIDCYSVKPIDTAALSAAAHATAGRIVVAEDHHPEGGLGSAVSDALLATGPRACRSRASWSARCPAPAPSPTSRVGPASTPSTSPRPPASCQPQMMSHHDPWPDRPEPTW